MLEKESVEKRVKFLQEHPDYQCVRSLGYYVLEETGERTRADERRGDLANENLFFPILNSETYVCCGCYMFRTERFFEIYPERKIPDSIVGQNLQMLLPFLYRYPCPTIQEELYRVYVRMGSSSRAPRTEEQEWKRCEELQKLIDTLAGICQITDRREKQLIECGKARIRFGVEMKYGKKWRAAGTVIFMVVNGGITVQEFVEKTAYIFFGNLISRVKTKWWKGEKDAK